MCATDIQKFRNYYETVSDMQLVYARHYLQFCLLKNQTLNYNEIEAIEYEYKKRMELKKHGTEKQQEEKTHIF